MPKHNTFILIKIISNHIQILLKNHLLKGIREIFKKLIKIYKNNNVFGKILY